MTRQENLIYRKQCPYDAMGDYSVLMENEKNIKAERNAKKSDPFRLSLKKTGVPEAVFYCPFASRSVIILSFLLMGTCCQQAEGW